LKPHIILSVIHKMKSDKQTIIDIRFISGRRSEIIESELRIKDALIKLAKYNYFRFINTEKRCYSFDHWVKWFNTNKDVKKIFDDIETLQNINMERELAGIPPLEEEVSLEKKILDHLAVGWVLKGCIVPGTDNKWVQTLVMYENTPKKYNLLMPSS